MASQQGSGLGGVPSGDAEFARLVREGAAASGAAASTGAVEPVPSAEAASAPDARRNKLRGTIASGVALLGIIRYGFLGLVLTGFGALVLFAELAKFEIKTFAAAVVALGIGLLLLRRAYSGYRRLRAI